MKIELTTTEQALNIGDAEKIPVELLPGVYFLPSEDRVFIADAGGDRGIIVERQE